MGSRFRGGLKGYLICTQAVINHLLEQNYGRIISVSSSAAFAREPAKPGVTVNSVAPGAVNTPMQDRLSGEFKAHMRSTIHLGRYAEPGEIGEMVAFLAFDRAS